MRRLLALFLVMAVVFGPAFSQKKETYRVRTVVIDPGHGGAKPGARGSRSFEKDITLDVAMKFGQLIKDNYPDVKVIYTRTTDVDISLAERAHIANRNKADLFISIHANSHPTSSPTGVETFVMGLSESKANLEVARKENADILLEADYKNNSDYQGFDPSAPETYVMLAMFQSAFLDKSLNFAQFIQNQYKRNIKTINRGVKQAELYVLYKTSMPSVLTEIGFISNPTEESYMLSDEGQAQIAVCLFNAFMDYKLAEDGTPKPANPVIKLKGYKGGTTTTTTPTTTPSQPAQQPAPQPTVEQDTTPAVVAEEVTAAPAEAEPTPTTSRPVPAVTMPQRVEPEQPVAQPTPTPTPEPTLAPAPAPQRQVAARNSNGLETPRNTASSERQFYTVQFLLCDRVLNAGARELGGIEEFEIIRKNNGLAYCCGRFATFQEANAYCDKVKASTKFRDAWVFLCRLNEGEQPVATSHAAAPAPTPAPTVTPQPASPAVQQAAEDGETVFRVQFLTSPREMQVGDPDLCGITDITVEQSGNRYIYMAGSYYARNLALRRCSAIRNETPFKDAYVVAYRNGVRVR